MYTACFLLVLCLLLGGHLEARPLPNKQENDEPQEELSSGYQEENMEGPTVPLSRPRFKVIMNRKKNRDRGYFTRPPYIPRGRKMEGSTASPEKTPTTKQKDKIIMYSDFSEKGITRKSMMYFVKIGVAVFGMLSCTCPHALRMLYLERQHPLEE